MVDYRQTSVIFLAKDRLDFFNHSSSLLIQLALPPSAVRFQEVVNAVILGDQIASFVTQNNIPVSQLFIILSDEYIYFKNFPVEESGQQDKTQEIAQFTQSVPFESVGKKIIKSQAGTLLIAANQDIYLAIKNSFEKIGFSVIGVIPGFAITSNIQALDESIYNLTISKINGLKEYNFISDDSSNVSEGKTNHEPVKETKNPATKRLYVFIGAFILLIVILLIVIFTQPAA